MTLLITKKEIETISMKEILEVVEKAFKAYGLGKVQMPAKMYLKFEKGDLRCMPGYINFDGIYAAGVKSVNVHPDNRQLGLPTVMALIILTNPDTGYPEAVMDGTLITALRTGASGGVAAKYLSRKDSKTAGFFGCGVQARTQLEALLLVRKIKKIYAYDRNPESAQAFCVWVKQKKVEAIICKTMEDACRDSDIIITTTPSNEPFLRAEFVKPGTHINAIGADAKGKEELFPELLKKSKVVVDSIEQASHSGEINVPVSSGQFKADDIYAELGEIVAGKKKGRVNNEEITVFDSTGLSIQDVASADLVFKKFKKTAMKIDFF